MPGITQLNAVHRLHQQLAAKDAELQAGAGDMLRAIRDRYGLTQSGLAKILAVSRVYISNLESGRERLGRDVIARLTAFLAKKESET